MKLKRELVAILGGCLLLAGCVHGQNAPGRVTQLQETKVEVNLSPATAEVVRMAQTGVDESVLLTYVSSSTAPFKLNGDADAIVYLRDTGISAPVISAMISHDSTLPTQTYNYDQHAYADGAQNVQPVPPPVTVAQPAQPIQPTTPPPTQQPLSTPPDNTPAPGYVQGAPSEVNYFYDDLKPYGSWVQLEGYGWCWQPSVVVVNRAWRPYCDSGHWVYTDAGWYWQSDYSWGWAPFHYGRWHMDARCGWVWFPDTVWSPAWVTWRYSGENCGWAPLPYHSVFVPGVGFRYNGVSVGVNFDFGLPAPAFTFVATANFFQHDIRRHSLPPARVTQVINNTTIVNNYTVNNNNVVVNHGVSVNQVAAATHTQVHTVAIRDVPAGSRAAVTTANRPDVVTREELHSRVKTTPVVAQKVDAQNPVVRHPVTTTVAKAPTADAAPARANTPASPARRGEKGTQNQPASNPRGRGETPVATTIPRGQTPATAPNTQNAIEPAHGRGQAAASTAQPSQPAQPNQPASVDRGNGRGRGQSTTTLATKPVQPSQPAQAVPSDRSNGRGRGQSVPVTTAAAPTQPTPSVPRPIQPVAPAISQPPTTPPTPVQHGNSHLSTPKSGGTSYSPQMTRPATPSPAAPPASVVPPLPSDYNSSAQPADNRTSSPKGRGHDK